jgi:Uma2 family endonuclease
MRGQRPQTSPSSDGASVISTITATQPIVSPVPTTWVPSMGSLYRLSIEQYEAMVRYGIFTKRDRLQLINGFLVAKPVTHNPPHSVVDELCGKSLDRICPSDWHVRGGKPIRLPNTTSVPEPDRCLVRGQVRDYLSRHPDPADIALVVEISDSSLSEDRAMAVIYGAGGVNVYWIVNLVDRLVEVYSKPSSAGYQSREIFRAGSLIPVVAGGVEIGQIAVAEIMP